MLAIGLWNTATNSPSNGAHRQPVRCTSACNVRRQGYIQVQPVYAVASSTQRTASAASVHGVRVVHGVTLDDDRAQGLCLREARVHRH